MGAAKDGDDGGEEAGAGSVAAAEGEPLKHLEGAGPAGTPNELDDEGEVSGGHLNPAVVEHVSDEGGGGEGEDLVGQELDALPPVAGALEGELRHLLRARPALLALQGLERVRPWDLGGNGTGVGFLGYGEGGWRGGGGGGELRRTKEVVELEMGPADGGIGAWIMKLTGARMGLRGDGGSSGRGRGRGGGSEGGAAGGRGGGRGRRRGEGEKWRWDGDRH